MTHYGFHFGVRSMVLPSGLLVPTSPRWSLVVYIMEWSRTFLCFKEASNWLNSGIKNILLASLGLVRFLFNFFLWEVFTTYGKYVAYVKESLPSAGIRFNISIAIYLMIKSLYLNLLMSGTNPEIFNYHRWRPWFFFIWWFGMILAFGLIFYIGVFLNFSSSTHGNGKLGLVSYFSSFYVHSWFPSLYAILSRSAAL